MTRRRTWIINGGLVLLLVGAGYGIYAGFAPAAEEASSTQARTTPVSLGNVTETVSASGTVASSYTANADFSTSGKVATIKVAVGDVVKKGQKLATLDATEANAQLKVAQSNLDVAEENLDNAESSSSSSAQGGQTESTTSLQSKVDQAELSLEQAQEAVDATVLTAPGDGTVTAINGAVGQQTGSSSGSAASGSSDTSSSSSSSGFIVLTNMSSMVVTTSVAEVDVSKVRAGQSATVTVNALPDTEIKATVASVDLTPTTSNSVTSYGASLTLNDVAQGLRPGQSASVVITIAEASNVLTVPAAAVQTTGTTSTVTVQQNGQQVKKRVELGVQGESTVEIKSGLSQGDQVVLTATSTQSTSSNTAGNRSGGQGGFPGGGSGGFPGGGAGGGQ
ncbi:HlyD family efflux transporter periplasmic adaptor subunit [Amycolatopsis acidicola]|uniref:HlyD family efflux transporter periplasmic adaptor subunit n=1 Tax=Amycolatopsis acidicola TaxID=2596893 RepID=A0A5N0UXB7_9PSEU|nr:biotin/lipoyl-binding protein [Amycolatopsis acidicola]KAA9157115.1 HlyD family efflux transporter periplasmic adaptor subunit [Amycolatopsis acidicola]